MFSTTAGVPEMRALFQRSPRTGGTDRTIPQGTYRPRTVTGTMRTMVAFVAVAAVLMTIGTVVAAVPPPAPPPPKDLFLPPRVKGICDDAFVLRADGGVAWLTLEGGMWEFVADGRLYDLFGVE